MDQHRVGVHFVADSERKTGAGPSCRWHKEAGCYDVRAAGCMLGLGSAQKKEKGKETRRACAAGFGCWAGLHSAGLRRREQADWARSQAERKFPFSFYFPSF